MLLALVVLAVAVGAWALVRSRRSRPAPAPAAAPADPLRRDPRGVGPHDVGVGAVVAYGGRDYVVRGTLEFDQDGFRWSEHLLDDASVHRWLSVEDDEELEVCLWEAVAAPELAPGAPRIDYAGTTFVRDEHGSATFRAVGTTGTAPSGRMEYHDYAAGDRRLSFERYGSGSWEVGVGEVVPPESLDVYPAPREGRSP